MFIEKMLNNMTRRLNNRQETLEIKIETKDKCIAELQSEIKTHYRELSRNARILNVLEINVLEVNEDKTEEQSTC